MGKYSKKKAAKQRKMLTAAIAVASAVLVLLIAVLVILGRDQAPEEVVPGTTTEAPVTEINSNMKPLLVENVKEQGDTVTVETTYGTVKYPYAFSDLVIVEAQTFENHAVLEFKAELGGTECKLYTLTFALARDEEGIPVGKLKVDGETYVVTAMFHDVTGLDDDNLVTFSAVQETFNDVVNSLSDNEGFTAED